MSVKDVIDESPGAWFERFFRGVALWGLICFVSSFSSWFWVARTSSMNFFPAIIAGIVCFVLAYAFVGAHPRVHRWTQRPDIHLTLRIGYLSRMAVSVIVPVGMAIDVYPGVIAGMVVSNTFGGDGNDFLGVFLITVVHGALLNVMLALYMGLVLIWVRRFWVRPDMRDLTMCSNCLYDLTGNTSGKCPECGAETGAGKCPGCGYDLTGNQSGKCPECGMMTAVKKE